MSYRHAIVRDLAWVMGSSALWRTRANQPSDGNQALVACSDHLARLDSDPSPLLARLDANPDKRLGHRFETFMAYWLSADTRYRILAQNLAVRDDRKTIGEFDFIILDKQQQRTLHLEVACKFYLGYRNTHLRSSWHGPMLKDRLDIKLEHMQSRQVRLAKHPASQTILQQLGLHIDEAACIIKGRLFYPLHRPQCPPPKGIARNHLRGWWCHVGHFEALAPAGVSHWQALDKAQWFSSQPFDPTMPACSTSDLVEHFQDSPQRPLCVAGFNMQNTEVERGFLVSDLWEPEPIPEQPSPKEPF